MTVAALMVAACSGYSMPTSPQPSPQPQPEEAPVANVYILPGAVNAGPNAFGDEAIVIFKGERMSWHNLDSVAHDVTADVNVFPEFSTTGALAPGAEKSFVMNTVGQTTIHCSGHLQMTGTLIVRER